MFGCNEYMYASGVFFFCSYFSLGIKKNLIKVTCESPKVFLAKFNDHEIYIYIDDQKVK